MKTMTLMGKCIAKKSDFHQFLMNLRELNLSNIPLNKIKVPFLYRSKTERIMWMMKSFLKG